MTNIQHPFLPGTIVLIRVSIHRDWFKDTVAKLHKSGKFTLKNQPGVKFEAQSIWRNVNSSKSSLEPRWEGVCHHDYYNKFPVLCWTPELEAKLQAEQIEEYKQRDRQIQLERAATCRRYEATWLLDKLTSVEPYFVNEAQITALRALVAMFGESSA